MIEQDRTRKAGEGRRPGRDIPGGANPATPGEAPGGRVVGEIGRIHGQPGGSDPAGDADLDPRADAERMAGRVIDDVDHNDEAD